MKHSKQPTSHLTFTNNRCGKISFNYCPKLITQLYFLVYWYRITWRSLARATTSSKFLLVSCDKQNKVNQQFQVYLFVQAMLFHESCFLWLTIETRHIRVTLRNDLPPKFCHPEQYPCHGNTTCRLRAYLWTQSWLSLHCKWHMYNYNSATLSHKEEVHKGTLKLT